MNNTLKEPQDQLALKATLERIEQGGIRKLNGRELIVFGRQYRRAASTLSAARTQGANDNQIESLNSLVSRAYGYVYHNQSKGWPSVSSFFIRDFPQSFRNNLHFIAAAFIVFVIGALFATASVVKDPSTADRIFPNATSVIENIAERHSGTKDWMSPEERPVMSSFIIANNVRISILAFATGVLACIGALFLMFYNGLMFGVIGAAIANRGAHITLGFWSFVAPHGVIELSAIFISAGAGLILGWAVLCPGRYSRSTALKLAGREAFKLILGVAAMLLVAGLIEGFFSPTMLPNPLKLSIAFVLFVMLYGYLFTAGSTAMTITNQKSKKG